MDPGAKAEKDQQVRPLTLPSPAAVAPSGAAEESNLRLQSSKYARKRRFLLRCCGCCTATGVVLGIAILVLALTVFKIKDPELTLNNIYVDGLSASLGTLDDPAVSVNATLTADISLKNPNEVSFRFHNSSTEFYYYGETVGVAYAPNGKLGAHRTTRMNLTVDVLADRVGRTNLTGTVVGSGELNVTTFTDVRGRVNVLGIYKRTVEVKLNCSVTMGVSLLASQIRTKDCQADVN